MKKILLLLLPILIIGGCEKDFNTVVDNQSSDYQVTEVSSFKDFSYFSNDSTITLFVKISSFKNVSSVYCNVYSSESKKLNSSEIVLYDDGNSAAHGDITAADGTFTNKFPLSQSYPIGNYLVEFFVTGKDDQTSKVAEQQFYYDNGQSNVPPVISDLVIPDTVSIGQTFIFSVNVADSNGLSDISTVFYELYRPDNTIVSNSQGISQFPLFDNGDTKGNGDNTAGDGIFTVGLTFPNGAPIGTWRFKFQAKDRRGAFSNIINHNVVIK